VSTPQHTSAVRRYGPLLGVLLLGLALRLLLWERLPRIGLISDEGEYLSAATWFIHGHGFNWYHDYLWTRAPLYPLFIALHLALFGETLTPIYISQTILSLLNVTLVYALAQKCAPTAPRPVGLVAAMLMALYLPFATYTQMLLSETLFLTLLLSSFLMLTYWRPQPLLGLALRPLLRAAWPLIAAGVLLGLTTLTRSITLMFLPIIMLWLWGRPFGPQMLRRLLAPILLAAFAFGTILPWTVYNSRIYGGPIIIDTTGPFNLLLGGRTAADGNRNDAATRDFVLALLGQKNPDTITSAPCGTSPTPLPNQAARQAAMSSEAICLILRHPFAFISKSLVELIDLFQINYTGAERLTTGFTTGRLPIWYALSLFLLDDTIYVLTLPLALLGWALARAQNASKTTRSLHILLGLWCAYNVALAPLLFAINRFRLPLLPFAFIAAAYALVLLAQGDWKLLRNRWGMAWACLGLVLFVIAASPYAYLSPTNQNLPSYLGPYPSSLASTIISIGERDNYLRTERIRDALQSGQFDAVRELQASGSLAMARINQKAADVPTLISALLASHQGQPQQALDTLPPLSSILSSKDVEAIVVRGDALRSLGQYDEARAMFGRSSPQMPTGFVDDANPVQWAWDWLAPAPLPNQHLDLAGDLDLGYISGCFLGEGDPQGTFRWCTDGAQLRFPRAGTGAPQTLVLRADGRGWLNGWLPVPPVQVYLGEQLAGTFTPSHTDVAEYSIALPAVAPGADIVITLRTPTFVPDAARYLSQQGSQVGQVQELGVRLDWAELR
jgi:tetratricopeptide (TPR) repeat protein